MTRPERPLALVTGASRGIGQATAHALAKDHDLVLVARDSIRLTPVRAEVERLGATATALAADLSSPSEVSQLISAVQQLDAPVTVLVNNAGVAPSAPLRKTTDESWAQVMAINTTAPFALMRALLPAMVAGGWGRIVNVASTAALKGYRFTPAYSASKGALLALTRAVAAEVSSRGVTVNSVCPGFTDTSIVDEAIVNIASKTGRDRADARASLERFSPQQRLVQPEEVANLVRYLVSKDAAAVHGQALRIDGGETTL